MSTIVETRTLNDLAQEVLMDFSASTKVLYEKAKQGKLNFANCESRLEGIEKTLKLLSEPAENLIDNADFNRGATVRRDGLKHDFVGPSNESIPQRPLTGIIADRISKLSSRLLTDNGNREVLGIFNPGNFIGSFFEVLDSIARFKTDINLSEDTQLSPLKVRIKETFTKVLSFAKEVLEDNHLRYSKSYEQEIFGFNEDEDKPVDTDKLMEIYRMMRFGSHYPGLLKEYDHENYKTNEPKRFAAFVQKLVELTRIKASPHLVEEFLKVNDHEQRLLEPNATTIR